MVYIRIKKINHGHYAYLVESKNTSAGPRQKVKQYLGKIIKVEPLSSSTKENIVAKSPQEFLMKLITQELRRHGFIPQKNLFQQGGITFSPHNLTITKKNNKEIVLHWNQGFLSTYTLERLFSFKKTKDLTTDAHTLAKHFLEAGLPLSREEFVQFYQLL